MNPKKTFVGRVWLLAALCWCLIPGVVQAEFSPRPTAGVPGAIVLPSSPDSDGSYTISWGQSQTSTVVYALEEKSGVAGVWTGVYTGSATTTNLSLRSTGTYFYRVRATKDGYWNSPWIAGASGVDVIVPGGTVLKPATITVPAANTAGESVFSGFTVSWTSPPPPVDSSNLIYTLMERAGAAGAWTAVYTGTDKSYTAVDGEGKTYASGTTYFYRVMANQPNHILPDSDWKEAANGCLVSLKVAAPGSVTVPATSGGTSDTYTVSWTDSSTAAVNYTLEEATDAGFTAVRTAYTGPLKTTSISGRAAGTTYYYRVKATKTNYTDSAWTDGGNGCAVSQPTVLAPASITVPISSGNGTYEISWKASDTSGASYKLEESTNVTFPATAATRSIDAGTATKVTITGRTVGTYYYRVKATKTNYTDSAWVKAAEDQGVATFTAGQPASITVPSSSATGTYDVSWSASSTTGAIYLLQESTAADFPATSATRTINVGTATKYTVTGRTVGSYYYRVKATKEGFADSLQRAAANHCAVKTAAPPSSVTVPVSSAAGAYVTWGTSATAGASYTLQWSTDPASFPAVPTNSVIIAADATKRYEISQAPGQTYYYRVKATKSGFADSAWVQGTVGCVVDQVAPPTAVTVPSRFVAGSSYVTWTASVTPGVIYTLQWSTDASFGDVTPNLANIAAGQTRYLISEAPGNTYYYRVKAEKATYSVSAWAAGNNGCGVAPSAPADLQVPASSPEGKGYDISWVASAGLSYELEQATNADFTDSVAINTAQSSAAGRTKVSIADSPTIVAGATYYYRVRATQGDMISGWTSSTGCKITNTIGFTQVSTGLAHSAGIKEGGSLWVWGSNEYGQLGNGGTTPQQQPEEIASPVLGETWIMVSTGLYHTVGILSDNTLWAWGAYGPIDFNGTNTAYHDVPTQIGSDSDWTSVSAGLLFTVGTKTDGTLYAWGNNDYGQLGDGTTDSQADELEPQQVGIAANWLQVSAGAFHVVGVKSDNTLWAWGANDSGQLGDGSGLDQFAPVQIGTATNWKQVSAGGYHTVARKLNNRLFAWGDNSYGQLGDGTTTDRHAPLQIGDSTNWRQVTAGFFHTVALKLDYRLFAWGWNESSQLGNGSTGNVLTPLQVGTAKTWLQVSPGWGHTLGVMSDGSLWGWGTNEQYQYGDGSTISQITPYCVYF